MLNVPLSLNIKLKDSTNVLLLSVRENVLMSTLPIYLFLKRLNKEVHIANFSSMDFATINNFAEPVIIDSNILGANSIIKEKNPSYQEGYLSAWMKQFFKLQDEKLIWFVNKVGPKLLSDSYKRLIHHLNIDTVVFVDFGIDSLLFGNEPGCHRTIIDNSINYSAFKTLEVKNKIAVILGASPEIQGEDIYFSGMRNLTKMSQQGGVLGSCNLMNYMQSFTVLKNACEFIKSQSGGEISPTNKFLISSIEGIDLEDINNENPYVSQLLSQYWFLDANAIMYNNIFLDEIGNMNTYFDAVQHIIPRLKK